MSNLCQPRRRLFVGATSFAIGTLALLFDAASQEFPQRPVTMIVPLAPGGPTDVLVRQVGEAMARGPGQPLVIENRTGAKSKIGANW